VHAVGQDLASKSHKMEGKGYSFSSVFRRLLNFAIVGYLCLTHTGFVYRPKYVGFRWGQNGGMQQVSPIRA
jgi:hypothetical protein